MKARLFSLAVCLGSAAALGFAGCGTAPPKVATSPKPPAARATAPGMTSADVDAALRTEWRKRGVTPAAPIDDARFLRRAYVDIVGTIPPPEKVSTFVADGSKDKRAKLVDELLASPAYAEHWADYWEDELLGQARAADIDRLALRVWLRDRFAKNTPWDKVVTDLVTATGQNGPGGERAQTLAAEEHAIARSSEPVNGAVNYALKYRDAPQDWAGAASKTFLGVQIQCAQCHDHKTERWTQQDFRKFAACFMRAQTVPLDAPMTKGPHRALVRDIDRPLPRFMKNPDLDDIGRAAPTALDGTPMQGTLRGSVAAWMVKTPWFAEEAVNRMWAHFLGRGFVDPVDDLRPSNPADAPELFDRLARDFAAHGFDLARLVRQIALSEAYALSTATPGEEAARPPVLWSRFRTTPLGPNELLDAEIDATGVDDALRRLGRFDVEAITERLRTLYGFVFDVDEELDRPNYEGTITQALIQLNGRLIAGGSTALPGTAVARIARDPGMTDAQRVEALYLRTLSREPTTEELDGWTKYLADPPPLAPVDDAKDAGTPAPAAPRRKGARGGGDALARATQRIPPTRDPKIAAFEDIMWTLLNSSEFVLNH